MRITMFLILLVIAGLLPGCTANRGIPALGGESMIEERRILVTFPDRHIEREFPVNPMDRYLPRGTYASSSWGSRIAEHLAEDYSLRLVLEWPITALGVHCVVYEVPRGRRVAQVIQTLAKDRRIDLVQPMQRFRVLGQSEFRAVVHNDPYYRLQVNFQAMHIEEAHRWATGRGVRIAVVDTGVDGDHPDLTGQISAAEDLVPSTSPRRDEVHGTAVAGVIAARADNGEGIVGVAPGAKLYALRACWPEREASSEGVCNTLTLALAINEAIRLKAQILNLSLTGPPDSLLERLIDRANEQGMLVVAADSNSPGRPSSFPANLENVIAVRNMTEQNQWAADARTVFAPGSEILTTVPHRAYDFMSGSSFSASHITGVIALMLELNPHLNGAETLRILQAAETLKPSDQRHGFAVVDGCLALARLRGIPDCDHSMAASQSTTLPFATAKVEAHRE